MSVKTVVALGEYAELKARVRGEIRYRVPKGHVEARGSSPRPKASRLADPAGHGPPSAIAGAGTFRTPPQVSVSTELPLDEAHQVLYSLYN